jgi:hypothetical protein
VPANSEATAFNSGTFRSLFDQPGRRLPTPARTSPRRHARCLT